MILVLGDLHIGLVYDSSKTEKLNIILDRFKDAEMLIMLGDIFDFYFECEDVVMNKYRDIINLLEKTAKKIPVFYIQGNHDFFPLKILQERGIKVIKKDLLLFRKGKSFYFTHGDLLSLEGFMTRIFLTFKLWQVLMKLLPCNFIYSIASAISKWSRKRSSQKSIKESFKKAQKRLLKKYDCVITAHLHKPLIERTPENKIYLNPGDWLTFYTFATLEDNQITLWEIKDEINKKEVVKL
ncbi:MAG: UDP-2,3-diacylglucosamine diphosphatase [candidate division WOR-3 bacterium]